MVEVTSRLSMVPDTVGAYDPTPFRFGANAITAVFKAVDLPVFWAADFRWEDLNETLWAHNGVTSRLQMEPTTTASYRPHPHDDQVLATVFSHVDLPATDAARAAQMAVEDMLEP